MRRAISSFRSRVLAMPVSSIVSATTAAPKRFTTGSSASIFARPASRFTEFTTARPGTCSSARAITSGSVESIMSGASTVIESSLTTRDIWSASSARSVSATHTSSTCAPDSTCSRATRAMPS